MTIFSTSLDKRTKIITFALTSLLFVVTLIQSGLLGSQPSSSAMFTAILLGVIYGITYALSPKQYVLTEQTLVIEKRLGKVSINRAEIENVELLADGALDRSVRTFGVGGLFGYFGKFYNANLGKMTWYATRKNNAVLVNTKNGKKIILTPDEASSFVKAF